jgi:hypothetical protein
MKEVSHASMQNERRLACWHARRTPMLACKTPLILVEESRMLACEILLAINLQVI